MTRPIAATLYRLLWIPILLVLLQACGNPDDGRVDLSRESAAETSQYPEGSNFPSVHLPENLNAWIAFYTALDTGTHLSRFRGSGVNLHFGPLESAASGDLSLKKSFFPLMAFSPDSSRAIDWLSYGHLWVDGPQGTKTLAGGETDQEVDLLIPHQGLAFQLMFNGPETLVESAAWVTQDAFLLGMIQVDISQHTIIPEIMLFNLQDSTFTNFRLDHSLPDSLLAGKENFTQRWLNRKNLQP